MTREEEINIAALRYIEENSINTISSNKDSFIEELNGQINTLNHLG